MITDFDWTELNALTERVLQHHPELVPACKAAYRSVEEHIHGVDSATSKKRTIKVRARLIVDHEGRYEICGGSGAHLGSIQADWEMGNGLRGPIVARYNVTVEAPWPEVPELRGQVEGADDPER